MTTGGMSGCARRRGSVYLAVVAVVAMVTVLVLSGVTLRKRINERAAIGNDSAAVRRLARSGSELVVEHARRDAAAFQTLAATGVVFSDLAVKPGVVSATVRDADTKGLPVESTTNFRVVTDATAGAARSRLSFLLEAPDDPLGIAIHGYAHAVAYWPLHEVNDSIAVDEIAGRNGTYGSPSVAGIETHTHGNPAPRMAWNNEFVRVPHDSSFELAEGTLAFWARFNTKPDNDDEQDRLYIVVKERSSLDSSMSLVIYLDEDDLVYSLIRSGESRSLRVSESKIKVGSWHVIAVTWGARGMELYLNGKREAQQTSYLNGLSQFSVPPLPWYRPANTQDWYFGVRNKPRSGFQQSQSMKGSMGRVSLFSQQLTESELTKLYSLSSMKPGFVIVPGSFARVTD